MDRDFWLARWQTNQIGFHEGVPNTLLVNHLAALHVPAGGRIFVPLCGKSHDMHWLLMQGFSVIGAELSRLAVTQFFSECGLIPNITAVGALERFEAGNVTIFAGDIFELDQAVLGPIDAVYDRAALVALPPLLRARYAAHIIVLTSAAPQLVVTFEYDQALQAGPPFAVLETDISAYYGATYELDCAERRDVPDGIKGLRPAQEIVWLLKPR